MRTDRLDGESGGTEQILFVNLLSNFLYNKDTQLPAYIADL